MHAKVKSGSGPEMEKYDILFATKYTKPPAHTHAISDSFYNVTLSARERQHRSCRVKQCRPCSDRSSLIWVYTVCQDLSVRKLRIIQDQDQDSLLVKSRNDNHSPGPVIRELVRSSHPRSELSNTILCIFSG